MPQERICYMFEQEYRCFRCNCQRKLIYLNQLFVCYAMTSQPERCYCDHMELRGENNEVHFICTVCIKKLEIQRFQFVRDHMEMSKAAERLMKIRYRPY